MTAPSREPTEAMRQLGHDIACRICGVWDRARGADIIARALMEQDAAARLATIEDAVIECGRAATALIAEGRVEASQGAINAANRIRARLAGQKE